MESGTYIDENGLVQPVDTSAVMWRYMSLAKLVAILQTQSLYFGRLDTLDEKWEATFPSQMRRRMQEDAGAIGLVFNDNEPRVLWNPLTHQYRRTTYVNCWCASSHESETLWRKFGAEQDGVAIQSTYSAVRSAVPPLFRVRDHMSAIFMGQVQYIDWLDDNVEFETPFSVTMIKRVEFSSESEVRLLLPWERWRTRWYSSQCDEGEMALVEGPPGFLVPVDLRNLVHRVVISPTASSWLEAVVRGLIRKYLRGIPYSRSALT